MTLKREKMCHGIFSFEKGYLACYLACCVAVTEIRSLHNDVVAKISVATLSLIKIFNYFFFSKLLLVIVIRIHSFPKPHVISKMRNQNNIMKYGNNNK